MSSQTAIPALPDEAAPLAAADLAPVPSGTLAVAVSGGPDSMALLWLIARKGDGIIHALTVDHNLRPDSAAEARQVGAWIAAHPALSARVRHHIIIRPPVAAGRLMERARTDRYELMAEYCARHEIATLLTAHHRDDQAETILFRLAKGSGLDGLGGIRSATSYNDRLTLCRPLLAHAKDRLIATCIAHDIPYVRDPTNDNPAFARNRLRAAMDVLGAEGLDAKRLATTAARLSRARQALDHYAACAYDAALIARDAAQITLSLSRLAGEPDETRRRVLMLAMTALAARRAYPPRMERFEDIADRLFADPAFRRATLAGFLIARHDRRDTITVTLEKAATSS